MRTLYQNIIVALLLAGFTSQLAAQEAPKAQSDSELRQKVAGVWKYTADTPGATTRQEAIYTFGANGYFAKQSSIIHKTGKNTVTASGTWQIKNGVIVVTVTKIDPVPQGVNINKVLPKGGKISQMKLVSANANELVIESNPEFGKDSSNTTAKTSTLIRETKEK